VPIITRVQAPPGARGARDPSQPQLVALPVDPHDGGVNSPRTNRLLSDQVMAMALAAERQQHVLGFNPATTEHPSLVFCQAQLIINTT